MFRRYRDEKLTLWLMGSIDVEIETILALVLEILQVPLEILIACWFHLVTKIRIQCVDTLVCTQHRIRKLVHRLQRLYLFVLRSIDRPANGLYRDDEFFMSQCTAKSCSVAEFGHSKFLPEKKRKTEKMYKTLGLKLYPNDVYLNIGSSISSIQRVWYSNCEYSINDERLCDVPSYVRINTVHRIYRPFTTGNGAVPSSFRYIR
ncbi:hypothetical protein V1478_006457 [Vespula squamosa]|uniref:Uncharacterized protein n=1 Tax=Vespula squamosa TaxID=30214 RepID=A0ABD2B7W3_VESSQ